MTAKQTKPKVTSKAKPKTTKAGTKTTQTIPVKTLLKDFPGDVAAQLCRQVLDDLTHTLEAAQPPPGTDTVGVLPADCRFFQASQTGGVMVIEERPKLRTVLVEHERYRLCLPYVVFCIFFRPEHPNRWRFAGVRVYFSKTPLTSSDQQLYGTHLPNSDRDGGVCMGAFNATASSPADLARRVITRYWHSRFSHSYMSPFRAGGKRIRSFAEWQRLADTDPLAVLQATFNRSHRRLKADLHEGGDHKKAVKFALTRFVRSFDTHKTSALVRNAVREVLKELRKKG